jgi:hypothetical protein
MLMHINEQTPRTLYRQLHKHFRHVVLWCGAAADPLGTLTPPRLPKFRTYHSIFAVASSMPLSLEDVRDRLTMSAVDLRGMQVRIRAPSRLHMQAASEQTVQIDIENRSAVSWKSAPPAPINASYHWLSEETGACIEFDGVRTAIAGAIPAGERRVVDMRVRAPDHAGRFRLRTTLVQEGVNWFDAIGSDGYHDSVVDVHAASGDPTAT